MAEARVERWLAAILGTDVVGYSRLMGGDEEGTLAALKSLRESLIDPKIAEHRGRIVKTTGDGALVELASAVDAVRYAIDIHRATIERNAEIPEDRRIELLSASMSVTSLSRRTSMTTASTSQPDSKVLLKPVEFAFRVKRSIRSKGPQNLKNIPSPSRYFRLRSMKLRELLAN